MDHPEIYSNHLLLGRSGCKKLSDYGTPRCNPEYCRWYKPGALNLYLSTQLMS